MGDEPVTQRRVEIVHESLLREWPRLVRWQTQDLDGAQLRDQLRQAAQLWEERGRLDDLLWTGTAFREFTLWRERYPGGLTEGEEGFATAMTRKALRLRRRRRLAVSLLVAALLVVLVVVTASRQQAVTAREEAEEAASRAEAQKLLALGQLELESSPTLALAHATKSLELADTPEARRFVLRALAAGPPATILPIEDWSAWNLSFSPDGTWAAFGGRASLRAISQDGTRRTLIEPFEMLDEVRSAFDLSGQHLMSANGRQLGVWSVPGFELIEEQEVPLNAIRILPTPDGPIVLSVERLDSATIGAALTSHTIGDPPRDIGRLEISPCPRPCRFDINFDRSARWVAYPQGEDLYIRSVDDWSLPPRRLGSHPASIRDILFDPTTTRVAAYDNSHTAIRIWSLRPGVSAPLHVLEAPDFGYFDFDPSGQRLAAFGNRAERGKVYLWNLDGPREASPLTFPASLVDDAGNRVQGISNVKFTPNGRWLATTQDRVVGFWPLNRPQPRVITLEHRALGEGRRVGGLQFTPDGKQLISGAANGSVQLWALHATTGPSRVLHPDYSFAVDVDPEGRFIALEHFSQTLPCGVSIVPLDGGPTRTFVGFAPDTLILGVAIDSEGRRVAAGVSRGQQGDPLIKVWDIETGDVQDLGRRETPGQSLGGITDVYFLPDGSLLSDGSNGLGIWSLEDGSQRIVAPDSVGDWLDVFDGGHKVAHLVETPRGRSLAVTDLAEGTTDTLPEHGDRLLAAAADPAGRFLVSADEDGVIRVTRATGGTPHLLLGHRSSVPVIRVSPDGRWIASAGQDNTVRLWPVPNLSKTPLQALPHGQLVARLHTLTNVRMVEDSESSTGWKFEVEPFPGWEEVPEW